MLAIREIMRELLTFSGIFASAGDVTSASLSDVPIANELEMVSKLLFAAQVHLERMVTHLCLPMRTCDNELEERIAMQLRNPSGEACVGR
jgi:hypothetical protein